jgi:hypothetical protein
MSDFVQPQPASISPPIGEAIERSEEACVPQRLAERSFPQWLANPWVDKILAILASVIGVPPAPSILNRITSQLPFWLSRPHSMCRTSPK